jgi:uncharacterized protein (TIGR02996 family)
MATARNEELEAAILENPSDPATWLVYGDWLTEHGDPRGELIAVQAQRAERPDDPLLAAKELKLITDHAAAWLGDLAPLTNEDFACTWRFGFLASVRFGPPVEEYATSASDKKFPELYGKLMALDSARFLRELTFGSKDADDWPASWGKEIAAIAEHGVPESLRRLVFDSGGFYDISSTELGPLAQIYPQLGALEELRIHMGALDLGEKCELPSLRSLEIETGGLKGSNLAAITAADWPKLERLSICIGESNNSYGCDVNLSDVEKLVARLNAPHLVHLGLCNSNLEDEFVPLLAKSSLLRRLHSIDLSRGTLSNAGARLIVEHAEKFRHLVKITLSDSYVDDQDLFIALRKIGPEVDLSDQQFDSESGEDRYVQIAE